MRNIKHSVIHTVLGGLANVLSVNIRQAISYMKCLADRFQLKLREEKTKRKKPPHFLK